MIEISPAMQETKETRDPQGHWEDPLEQEIAAHFGILACKILWTEEPHGLQSTGLQMVRHK